jgi:hypothetical protein
MVNSDDLDQVTTDINGNPTDDNTQDPHAIKGDTSATFRDDEESFAGSAAAPGSDDDTDSMMAQVTGNEPPAGERGTTIAEQVNMDEANRHGSDIGSEGLGESLAAAPGDSELANELEAESEPNSTNTDSTPPDDKQ